MRRNFSQKLKKIRKSETKYYIYFYSYLIVQGGNVNPNRTENGDNSTENGDNMTKNGAAFISTEDANQSIDHANNIGYIDLFDKF